jgi:hypothetical protein
VQECYQVRISNYKFSLLYLSNIVDIVIFLNKEQYFRYESKCQKVMEHKMVEEKRPICKVEIMNKDHTKCEKGKSGKCKRVMKCSLGMKMMAKTYPRTLCEDIAIGEEEKCVDMVKLNKEKHEAKYCSFHPKTICKKTDGMKCRRVAKKICHYVAKN